MHQKRLLHINLSDAKEDSDKLTVIQRHEAKCLIIAPLIFNDTTIGILEIIDKLQEHPYHPDELKFIQKLGDIIAIVLHNTKKYNRYKHYQKELKLFLDTTEAISSSLDSSEALTKITKHLAKTFNCSSSDLYIYHKNKSETLEGL